MMGTSARAAMAYGQAAQTLPPARQIVLLYDGAIGRLREARRAVDEGRIEDRFDAVRKASAIVDALHACLDLDRGGEIAATLDRLYTYLSLRMQRVNTGNDAAACEEVISRLGELRSAWAALADGAAPPVSRGPQTFSAAG